MTPKWSDQIDEFIREYDRCGTGARPTQRGYFVETVRLFCQVLDARQSFPPRIIPRWRRIFKAPSLFLKYRHAGLPVFVSMRMVRMAVTFRGDWTKQ